jgi:UPF0271 protein
VAREHKIDAEDGSDLTVDVPTICLHGDAPNAVEIARAVKAKLDDAGVEIRALRQIVEAEAASAR